MPSEGPRAEIRIVAVVGLLLVAASAHPVGSAARSASLEVIPSTAAYREPVRVGGALSAEARCLGDRTVELERRTADAAGWEPMDRGATETDGSFGFVVRPEVGATYRAVVAEEERGGTVCGEIRSPGAVSRVRARVTIRGNVQLRASRCGRVPVVVRPSKPGQTIEVERRSASGWHPVAQASLDERSRGVARVCARWSDLGEVRLRARWPSQDPHNLGGTSGPRPVPVVRAAWMRRIDRLTEGLSMGVSVREAGAFVYRRQDTVARAPASNQKLVLSMALLDAVPAETRLPTTALGVGIRNGVVRGDLWIAGQGDPEVGPRTLRRLALRLQEAGLRRVRGSVRGSTRSFARDWWAPGWRSYFPSRVIALPSALTFQRNAPGRRHVRDPERHVARALTRALRRLGIPVRGPAGMGAHPRDAGELARVTSRPLRDLLATTNTWSANFHAEVLGKRLGLEAGGPPGSIAKGATAMTEWAGRHGVRIATHDASGLSYANRATPAGIVRLLDVAEGRPWGETFRGTLAPGGGGTLSRRLAGEPVRAKTGTLSGISALSGWVLADRTGTWIDFSIMSSGPAGRTKPAEDAVVRILRRQAA